jgi:large subunit GTPase 1
LAKIRGFYTAHGNPDEARAARIVLKDYVTGKMIHCELPPGVKLKPDEVDVQSGVVPELSPELGEEEVDTPREVTELPQRPKKSICTVNPKRRGVIRFSSFV